MMRQQTFDHAVSGGEYLTDDAEPRGHYQQQQDVRLDRPHELFQIGTSAHPPWFVTCRASGLQRLTEELSEMKNLLLTTAMGMAIAITSGGLHAQTTDQQSSQNTASSFSCDKSWASVDGNEDGFVSREEASGAAEAMFSQLDADGNGEITKTEWVDCRSANRDLSSAETDRSNANFAGVDANEDQQIDPSEFRSQAEESYQAFHQDQSASKDSGSQTEAASSEDADPVIILRRYVWLTPEEAGSDETVANMSEDEMAGRAAANFRSLDGNGDGVLDTQEWSQSSSASGVSEDVAGGQFDTLDGDSSGAITRSEFMSYHDDMVDGSNTASTGSQTSDDAGQDQTSASRNDMPVFIYRFLSL
jgi:Ca2+-binding EF-hand superfamily protein